MDETPDKVILDLLVMLPCPFCGSDRVGFCETDYQERKAYAISCTTKGCHGVVWALGFGLFESREEAIRGWNIRA